MSNDMKEYLAMKINKKTTPHLYNAETKYLEGYVHAGYPGDVDVKPMRCNWSSYEQVYGFLTRGGYGSPELDLEMFPILLSNGHKTK